MLLIFQGTKGLVVDTWIRFFLQNTRVVWEKAATLFLKSTMIDRRLFGVRWMQVSYMTPTPDDMISSCWETKEDTWVFLQTPRKKFLFSMQWHLCGRMEVKALESVMFAFPSNESCIESPHVVGKWVYSVQWYETIYTKIIIMNSAGNKLSCAGLWWLWNTAIYGWHRLSRENRFLSVEWIWLLVLVVDRNLEDPYLQSHAVCRMGSENLSPKKFYCFLTCTLWIMFNYEMEGLLLLFGLVHCFHTVWAHHMVQIKHINNLNAQPKCQQNIPNWQTNLAKMEHILKHCRANEQMYIKASFYICD